ncbi:hypothetical protein ACFLYR_09270 [Chloroflexota bacterium]
METKEYPSMDTTYEWGRQAPERLSMEASSLDSKILGVFASSAIIISLTSTAIDKVKLDWTIVPFVIASLCFLVILGKSIWALHTRLFIVTDNPHILEKDYWELEPTKAKMEYWKYTVKAFNQNYRHVNAKGIVLRWIVPLLAFEVISLVAWLFLATFV